jgi:hypothetical protein
MSDSQCAPARASRGRCLRNIPPTLPDELRMIVYSAGPPGTSSYFQSNTAA